VGTQKRKRKLVEFDVGSFVLALVLRLLKQLSTFHNTFLILELAAILALYFISFIYYNRINI